LSNSTPGLFEVAYLPADRGPVQEQFLGGGGEAEQAAGAFEAAESRQR
jgi:hypothetical protein